MSHDEALALIERHYDGDPSMDAGSLASLRAHLRGCEPCRRAYDEAAEVERALAGTHTPPQQVARLRALGPPGVARPRLEPSHALSMVFALAAALLLVVVVGRPGIDDGFAPRGGESRGKQAWMRVFVTSGGAATPLGKQLPRAAGLLFSVSNLSSSPARFVAIAGRDANGRVHWYHPGWTDAAQRPSSLALAPGTADRELPDAVYAEHAPGPLELCALFSETRLEVARVDASIEKGGAWPEGVPRDCHRVEVVSR